MSRSRKRVCGGGICTGSNHEWTKSEHRRERHAVKQKLYFFMDEDKLPHPKQYHNWWSSPSDGKIVHWWPWEFRSDEFQRHEWKIKSYNKMIRK